MPIAVPDWITWLLLILFVGLFSITLIALFIAALPTYLRHNHRLVARSRLIFTSKKLPFPFSPRHRSHF